MAAHKSLRDVIGEERFNVLCVLADLQTRVADAQVEFVTSGGDPAGLRSIVYDLRRDVEKLATAVPSDTEDGAR